MPGSSCTALTARCITAVEQIDHECRTARNDVKIGQPSSSLVGCEEPLVQLLQIQAAKILELYRDDRLKPTGSNRPASGIPDAQLLLQSLEELLSTSYSKFYTYLSAGLPFWLRQLYTDASILKFSVLFITSTFAGCLAEVPSDVAVERRDELENELSNMVKVLDLAIILAGAAGHVRGRWWVDETLALLEDVSTAFTRSPGAITTGEKMMEADSEVWVNSPSFSRYEPFTPPVKNPIRRTRSTSMESFQVHLDRPADGVQGPEPVVISGLVDHWPALTTRPWDKPSYLLSRTFGGRRLVPVEVGRSYVDDEWDQKLITIGEFMQEHISSTPVATTAAAVPPSSPPTRTATAYLAQHPLLAQLPSLRADITTPDLCYTAPPPHPDQMGGRTPELDEPQLNAWFGPPGTITPLHTDPHHNLLVQVVGRKYVRLYAPVETPRMRPGASDGVVDMANTSRWDVGVEEGWDADDDDTDDDDDDEVGGGAAGFGGIPFVDCILEPGDTLYIPMGWWHYVRGLSVSFSVSFWWN